MITQSGGVGMSVLNLLANEGLGLNKFVSVGNMLDMTAEDLLEYMIDDEGTSDDLHLPGKHSAMAGG